MIDILNFVEDAGGVIGGLMGSLPSGSCVAVMQVVKDERLAAGAREWSKIVHLPLFVRDRGDVARWLDGLELVEPGIVEVHQWRPARGDRDYPLGLPLLGAVARKPWTGFPACRDVPAGWPRVKFCGGTVMRVYVKLPRMSGSVAPSPAGPGARGDFNSHSVRM